MNRINGVPKPSFRGFENQTYGIRNIKVRTGQRIFVEDPKTGKTFPVWVKVKKEVPTWLFLGGRWIPWASAQDEETLKRHSAAPKSKKYIPPKLKEETPKPEPKRQVVVRRRKGERKMCRVSCN
tara:strand:- start:850 stop:1221 length:372 start_codon:yes stop_codon:yes gene_type:complete